MMAEDPRASAAQLEELIIQEPGLVTHLLKMVNSAFYARPQKIDSIRQTVVILGMNTVRSLPRIPIFHHPKACPLRAFANCVPSLYAERSPAIRILICNMSQLLDQYECAQMIRGLCFYVHPFLFIFNFAAFSQLVQNAVNFSAFKTGLFSERVYGYAVF